MAKLKIGLFFGGRSTEHEVSVISALQAYKSLNKEKYEVVPVYVTKEGQFFSDPKLLELKNYRDIKGLLLSSVQNIPARIGAHGGLIQQGFFKKMKPLDLAFPLFHGSFGEDGCIQGLFEIYQIPYVGFNVTGSAIAMDKVQFKAIVKELGYPVANYTYFSRNAWIKDPKQILKQLTRESTGLSPVQDDTNGGLKFPMFVKPATGGSSIGAGKAKNEDELSFAIEVASAYAEKIIVEEAFEGLIEVNCSALGYGLEVKTSVCEQPIPTSDILSFADKYQRGGGKKTGGSGGMETLSRIIPAPISAKLTKEIQRATEDLFKALDGCGVTRVDFFVDPKKEKFWVNEMNTPPGSLAFYLWEKSGIKYTELLDLLIGYALKREEDKKKTQYVFNSGLLQEMAKKSV